jgi:hypothetical protein
MRTNRVQKQAQISSTGSISPLGTRFFPYEEYEEEIAPSFAG